MKRKIVQDDEQDDNVNIFDTNIKMQKTMSENISRITHPDNLNIGDYILMSSKYILLKVSLKYLVENEIQFIRPQCQRTLDLSIVQERYDINLKKNEEDMDFGVIKGAINENDGTVPTKLYILDGQHRLAVLEKLLDNNNINPSFILDLRIVYSTEEMSEYFKYINTARIVDIDTCYFDSKEKKLIEDLTTKLYDDGLVLPSTKRINRPYLSQDIIGRIFKNLGEIKDSEDLYCKLKFLNETIQKQSDDIKYDKLKNHTKYNTDIVNKFSSNYIGLLRPGNTLWITIFGNE